MVLKQFIKLHGAGTTSADPQKEQLVQVVKNYQRRGEEQKQIWHDYADTQLAGVRDPARHDVATLRTFAQTFGLSTQAVPAASPQPKVGATGSDARKDQLVQRVKAYQRSGQEQKDAWHTYADSQLGGVRDPARHDASALQDFIMAHDVPPASEPAAKRMKDSSGAPLGTAVEDPVKQSLVLQIKAYQRANQQQKDTWHDYADANLDGIRDPARHDASALQDFIDLHGVPQTAGSNLQMGSNPVKDQLVAQVKAFQTANQAHKDLWHNYADLHLGGTRDPARHDAVALQQFFSTVQI